MNLPHFSFYPRDWLADVAHLSYEERGVFFDLLCHMWVRGEDCALPDDDRAIAKLLRVTPARWRKWKSVLIESFSPVLFQKNGKLFSRRLQKEYQKALDKSGKRTDAAYARWGTDKPDANALQMQSKSDANDMHDLQHQNTEAEPDVLVGTKERESKPIKSIPKQTSARRSVQSAEAIDNFNVFAEALWENYPRDKDGTRPGRKAKFLEALRKVSVAEWDDIEAGLEKYKLWAKVQKGFVLNAETWVKERVWVESLEAQPPKQLNGAKPSFDDPEVVAKYTTGYYAPAFNPGKQP